jgi:hypothetical protein
LIAYQEWTKYNSNLGDVDQRFRLGNGFDLIKKIRQDLPGVAKAMPRQAGLLGSFFPGFPDESLETSFASGEKFSINQLFNVYL